MTSENQIHPTAVLLGDVTLGSGNYIGPQVVLQGPLELGNENYIGAGSIIGTPPEDAKRSPAELLSDPGEGIIIGDGVVIRELVTVHSGIEQATRIDAHAWVHSRAHIDHDCHLHERVVLAPGATLGGRITLHKRAQIGMNAAIHQGISIWGYSMIGMSAAVVNDIPPATLAYGVPAKVIKANEVRLEREGVPRSVIETLSSQLSSGISQAKFDSIENELPSEIVEQFRAYFQQMRKRK